MVFALIGGLYSVSVVAGAKSIQFMSWIAIGAIVAGMSLSVQTCWQLLRGRIDVRSFAAIRWGFCLLVAWWLVVLIWLQPFEHGVWATSLGLSSALYGAAVYWAHRKDTHGLRLPRWIDLIAFNVCLIVLLAEIGLRVLAIVSPSPLLVPTEAGVVERLRGYMFGPDDIVLHFPCNSLGFIDDEFVPPEQRMRPMVALLTDSFGGAVVPHYYNLSTVCEREADIDVYNFGVPSIGPDHYLYLLKTVAMQFRPEAVVVAMFLGNDLLESVPRRRRDDLIRRWFLRDNVMLHVVPSRLSALTREEKFKEETERSRGRRPITDPQGLHRAFPELLDYRKERPTLSEDKFLEIATQRAVLTSLSQEERYEAMFSSLKEIVDVAGDAPVFVVLIPAQWHLEDALWRRIEGRTERPLNRYRQHRTIRAWLDNNDIKYLDLLPVLQNVPAEPDGDRHLFKLRDTHFNARGHEVAGKAIARFIQEQMRR